MTQETAKAVIDRLQFEAGCATGGYVDRLVFSGLDVHEMLNEIEQAIDTGENNVEKLQEQLNTAKKALTEIDNGTWHSRDRGLVVDISDGETVSLFTLTEQALAAIGGDDE